MPTPFANWTADEVKKALQARKLPAENAAFMQGDHWQGGAGWAGPRPDATHPNAATVMGEIERAFVSQNAIKEVVERAASGVVASEPDWELTPRRTMGADEQPTPQEDALIAEAEAALIDWIEQRNAVDILRETVQTMLVMGRGPMRLFVPAGELQNGTVPRGDLLESILRVYLHEELDAAQAGLYRDQRTQAQAAIHVYKDDNDKEITELAYVDMDMTILRVFGETGEGAWTLPLGKRLPVYELKRKPLITPQIVSLQKLLNLALTMMQRNVVQGGFLERVLLNAQLPGKYETAADGTRTFVPDPLYVGAGTTNAFTGVSYTDRDGNTQLATPSVVYRDPVSVDTFRETKAEAYTGILSEAHQLHYSMAGDAVASGVSRITAMADHLTDLAVTAAIVERAWAWLLETALAMAAVFAGTPGRFEELMITAQCEIDAGPMTPEEKRLALDAYREGVKSLETTMLELGVDDPKAEMARIAAERAEQGIQPQGAQDEIEGLFGGLAANEQANQTNQQNGAQPQFEGATSDGQ